MIMETGEEKHDYKITCVVCDKELHSSCVMRILEFMTQHKECKNKNSEDSD